MRCGYPVVSGKYQVKRCQSESIAGFRPDNQGNLKSQILQKAQGSQRLDLPVYGVLKFSNLFLRKVFLKFPI